MITCQIWCDKIVLRLATWSYLSLLALTPIQMSFKRFPKSYVTIGEPFVYVLTQFHDHEFRLTEEKTDYVDMLTVFGRVNI